MRVFNICVPLATLVLAAIGCDGTNSPGAPSGTIDNSPPDSQAAPNTATQPAGNTATQPAGNTATQPAGNTATQFAGGGTQRASTDCLSACNHAASLGCSEDSTDCASVCAELQAFAACQSAISNLLACAAAANNCDALDDCDASSGALDDCVDGSEISPAPPPTTASPTAPTISDPANCNTGTSCGGCEALCDACVCALQLTNSTPSVIASTCTSYCSS